MRPPEPVTLKGHGVSLEPMTAAHAEALGHAAADGNLWELWFTSVPGPTEVASYIRAALAGLAGGSMLPWVVRDLVDGQIVGSTRYHDVVAAIGRVEIGYTWYAASRQRSHVNSACKLLLMEHAFERLGCEVVGLRTDHMNFRSQKAIEALGVRRDGTVRHYQVRPDGTARDTVFFSLLAREWPDVRRHLEARLARHRR